MKKFHIYLILSILLVTFVSANNFDDGWNKYTNYKKMAFFGLQSYTIPDACDDGPILNWSCVYENIHTGYGCDYEETKNMKPWISHKGFMGWDKRGYKICHTTNFSLKDYRETEVR